MRTIKLLLIITGCGALFMGVALAAIATSPLLTATTSDSTSRHHTTYFVLGTCVTCHRSNEQQWDDAALTRLIESPIQNPRASEIAMSANGDSAGSLSRSASSSWGHAIADMNYQQYVLLTETGYQVLPDHWKVSDQWYFVSPSEDRTDSFEDCSDCHTDELSALLRASAAKAPPLTLLSALSILQSQARLTFITEEQIS